MSENRTCHIVGAGDFCARSLTARPGDFVIAADGGYSRLSAAGVTPDLLLGDFDSLERVPELPEVLRYPKIKDDTDMMLAVRLGLERGFRRFCLYGGTGGRLDHTLANLQTLRYLSERDCEAFLIDPRSAASCLSGGSSLSFPAGMRGFVSVFAQGGPARGVRIRGLMYSLEDAELHCDMPLGVSNEFLDGPASVSVSEGCLLVWWQTEPGQALPELRLEAGT